MRRPCLRRSGYAQAGEILCRERFETVPYCCTVVRRNGPAPCLTRGRMSLPALPAGRQAVGRGNEVDGRFSASF